MIFFSGLTREHKQVFSSLIVVGFLSTGCGGGSSSADNSKKTVVSGTYTVKIVDDNIIGTTVSAPECTTFTDNGSGSYTLKECTSTPSIITAVGGYIDINGNGSQDTDEASQDAPLKLKVSQSGLSNSFMVTPLTTLATQETDLTTLATKLGVSKTDLFKDNAENRNLQRSINALLIAARAAGITKYDTFIKDFKDRILKSSNTGLIALSDAKNYMDTHSSVYRSTYGIVFGGFISDITGIDLNDGLSALSKAKGATVPADKIRLGGFIYDGIIANADITIYDGATPLATTTSNAKGRYALEIATALLSQSKVLKIVAISGKTKLIAYITTDELKAGLIGQKLSNAQVEDLIVSNVTTAKAVLVEKTAPTALTDAKKMVAAKTRVEQLYPTELITVAAAIKDVVDNNKTITQTDTILLAQDIVTVDATTKAVTTTVPSGITVTGTVITGDPLLNGQLKSTQALNQAGNNNPLIGAWHSKQGTEFNYLVMFADNTFVHAKNTNNNPSGVEVGTYVYNPNAGNTTFHVSYDDLTSVNGAGVADIGAPGILNSSLSNGNNVLTLDTATFNATNFTGGSNVAGVWRDTNSAGFVYLVMFADNTFFYAENDLTATSPGENGLEAGTYTYDANSGNITFNLTYDDNIEVEGGSSGVGSIDTPAVIDSSLSNGNNTISLLGGKLVLSKVF